MGNRWTRQEDQLLLDGAGVFAIDWFQRKTERTRKAIYQRAFDLYGRGGLSRGTFSLQRAATETGYSRSQLQRAQRALGQLAQLRVPEVIIVVPAGERVLAVPRRSRLGHEPLLDPLPKPLFDEFMGLTSLFKIV